MYPHISFKKTKTTQEHVMDKKVAPSMARETPREAQRGPERLLSHPSNNLQTRAEEAGCRFINSSTDRT